MRPAVAAALLALLASPLGAQPAPQLREEVRRTEVAFAKTMADRDHAAFASFLADDTVFFGGQGVQRGKASVAQAWKRFYEGKDAPFSWTPEVVEVLDGGDLGFSSGPVLDPGGRRVGTFSSVWRREKDGKWRIIFDKGCPPCDCPSGGRPNP
jgi:ketosteroid isomerase-like protein